MQSKKSTMDIIALLSSEADKAVDQIIVDSKRLHTVVNGSGTEEAITEDGSRIPSVRKALLDNLYFKVPPIPWRNGTSVKEYNQLYSFTDNQGITTWWYAPGATNSAQVVMGDSPLNNAGFKLFMDRSDLSKVYAPINSPLFTGNPRVPTPAEGDSSRSIANTEWVKTSITKAIEDALGQENSGIFDNITVKKQATLNDVSIAGKLEISSPLVSAPLTAVEVRKLTLKGDNAAFTFDPVVGKKTTNLEQTRVTSEDFIGTNGVFDKVTVGIEGSDLDSIRAHGKSTFDSVVIKKNANQPAEKDTLNVGGVTRVFDLIVEGSTQGIKANVDGADIKPKTVETTSVTADSVTAKKLRVTEETSLSGKTTMGGEISIGAGAKVTGLPDAVKGQDFDLGDVKVKSITSSGMTKTDKLDATTATIETLTITSSADMSRADINPKSVTSLKFVSVPVAVANPAANFIPDGTGNVYNVTVNKNLTLNPPNGLVGSGQAMSVVLYLTQDNIGNRSVTLGGGAVKLGPGDFNVNPLGVTVVQMLYSGFGNIVDVIVSARG